MGTFDTEGSPDFDLDVPAEMSELIVEMAPIGLVVLDDDGVITWTNQVYADKLDIPRAELAGTYFPELIEAGFYDESVVDEYREALEVLRTEADVDAQNYVVRTTLSGGEVRFYNVNLALLPTEDGEFRGTISAFQDITTRKEYERELERRNDQLEAFASVVSHDLRNPLNVARGYLEEAMETGDADALQEVASAHDRMETLVEDLLSLAREGQRVQDTREVDLREVARTAWASVDTATAHLDLADDLGTVEADPGRLKQAFENLFRNAVEHGSTSPQQAPQDAVNHAGPDVTIRVGRLDDGSPEGFYVADDGPGIPAEERDAVFERGYTTSAAGTGFGLAIVETIVEAHGWTIEAVDGSDGARFEVTTDGQASLDVDGPGDA